MRFSLFMIYLKLKKVLTIKCIFTILISFLFSNIVILYLENDFETFYSEAIKGNLEGKQIEAKVVSNSKEGKYYNQYQVKIIRIEKENKFKNKKIIIYVDKEKKLNFGEIVYITGVFQELETIKNTGSFKYKDYLKQERIYGALKVENLDVTNKRIKDISYFLNETREVIKERIEEYIKNEEYEFFISILLGDKTNLSKEVISNFQATSLSHLIAISGAHISYILIITRSCIKKLNLGKIESDLFISCFLLFYLYLVGNSPSAFRAVLMCILTILAQNLHRKTNSIHILCVTLLISILMNPYDLFSSSLLYSYSSVLAIFMFEKKIEDKLNKIFNIKFDIDKISQILKVNEKHYLDKTLKSNKKFNSNTATKIQKFNVILFIKIKEFFINTVSISISVQIIILPIMLYQFNTLSTYFLITNLITIPIFSAIMILGMTFIISIFLFPPIAWIISIFLTKIIQSLLNLTQFFSKLPFATIKVITPSFIFLLVYYAIVFFLYQIFIVKKYSLREKKYFQAVMKNMKSYKYFLHNRKMYIALIILIVFLFSNFTLKNKKEINIHFIDVGQGDSCLIITETKKKILIDGGGSEESDGFNVGENVLVPYLLDKRIRELDYVMISHFDSDHVRRSTNCNGTVKGK